MRRYMWEIFFEMSFNLSFRETNIYDSRKVGITLAATLRRNNLFVTLSAKVDTGAEVCLFERRFGEALEIQIESGYPKRLATLTGSFLAYGHEIVLETLGIELDTFVYFAETDEIQRNLLGRHGWLQLLKLGLIDGNNEIFLSPHDEDFR